MIAQRPSFSALFCCVAFLAACSWPKYEWSRASSLDTIAAYRNFLSKYPYDEHAADAQSRIAALQDEQAWTTAQIASSVKGYREYLSAQPNGVHAPVAREQIAKRERLAAWRTAQSIDTAQSLERFLDKYPSGDEADQARDRLQTIARYRAQLGVTHSQRLADRERDALAKRFGGDLRQIVVLEPDAKGREYRITSAPMSEQSN